MSGFFKLNRNFFKQEKLKSDSILQASYDTRVSRPTLMKYFGDEDETPTRIDSKVLYAILIDGMGLSIDEIEGMRVGDLFSLVEDEEAAQ